MRDPERIKPTIQLLEEAWRRTPDWRLGQLISNLAVEDGGVKDPFYMEDEALVARLKEVLDHGWV